ncbi:hypothetical protein L9F63_005376, partial [Diploptera punctata]
KISYTLTGNRTREPINSSQKSMKLVVSRENLGKHQPRLLSCRTKITNTPRQ